MYADIMSTLSLIDIIKRCMLLLIQRIGDISRLTFDSVSIEANYSIVKT